MGRVSLSGAGLVDGQRVADPTRRAHTGCLAAAQACTNNFWRLGFTEDDVRNDGSDYLIDAIVACGNVKAIQSRIRVHRSAGADHVCIQVLTEDREALPLREWRELASVLVDGAEAPERPGL